MMPPFLYKLIGRGMALYNRIMKPTTRGVRAIVVNAQNEILLVEHQLDGLWYLPGGGLGKNEDEATGLLRELKEELNLKALEAPEVFSTYQNNREYKKDTISIFVIKNFEMAFKKNLEIKKMGFFNAETLPEKTSPGTKRRIAEYYGAAPISVKW